ncbi:MAG: hypothetical protein KJZ78_21170 [Bryobacteraceae bacterium]|nr:hypothetical protein [Bryobacteraceae bacterium]
MFETRSDWRDSPVADWSPLLASAAVAAALALAVNHIFRSPVESFPKAILRPTFAVLSVFLASLCAALLAYRFTRISSNAPRLNVALAFAGWSVWMAPLVLFLMAWNGAVWLALLSGALAIGFGRLVQRYRRLLASGMETGVDLPSAPGPVEIFASLAERPPPWSRCALGLSLCIQSGIAALMFGNKILGAFLFAAAGLFLAWSLRKIEDRFTPIRFRPSRSVVSVLCAIALMAWIGGFGRRPLYPGSRTGGSQGKAAARADSGLLSSVILKSKNPRHVVLIAPRLERPPSATPALVRKSTRIPFSGEYWFLSWPSSRPSATPMIQFGSPMEWLFTNMDRHPLTMIARQPLGTQLSMSCCNSVEVEVSALPQEASTVSVGVYLVRTGEERRFRRQSLGTQELSELQPPEKGLAAGRLQGTLHFAMPASSVIDDFDEIHAQFFLHMPRSTRSARVEVLGFTLRQ